ncbi:YIP1 family protein [Oceaniglobus indicus]|uniref:YIP1 family protein n=1 Tax=Oceaniglobus indicus TaxID=2047749 RepID=UPI000C1A2EFD|nr:YIP1 family protein [Oceaniglobus indicus]
MALTRDIVASYRRPGAVVRRRAAGRPREDRALVTLMLACGLIFVAQWPRLSREAFLSGQPIEPLLAGALMGWLFIAPLFLYGLAAVTHLMARTMGGQGDWYGARIALFWALLAASPLWLLWGLVAGFIGPGPAMSVTGIVAFGAFLAIWLLGLLAVEKGEADT